MNIEVIKQAAEQLDIAQSLLERSNHHPKILAAYHALRQAIEGAEQAEPIGKWVGDCVEWTDNPYKFKLGQPLFLHPPTAPAQPVGIVTGPCGQCKSTEVPCYCSSGVAVGIKKLLSAAPAAPAQQPLTLNQIDAIENKVYMATTNKSKPKYEYALALVRAVEQAHGIKGASL